MYQHIRENHTKPRRPEDRVLSISGSQELCGMFGYEDSSVENTSYPECSILNLPFEDGCFDAVMSDQVLEHVKGDPRKAVEETLRVLKPGGLLVHTTCFLNPIHETHDYWRFTPDALRLLVGDKAEVIESLGWGNVFIWGFLALRLRYERIPHNRFHPFNWLASFNQGSLPVTTWVVATEL